MPSRPALLTLVDSAVAQATGADHTAGRGVSDGCGGNAGAERFNLTGPSTPRPTGRNWDVAPGTAPSERRADKPAQRASRGNAQLNDRSSDYRRGSSAAQRRIIFVGGKHRSSNGVASAHGGKATNSALNPQPIPPGKRVGVVPALGR